jgi:hypothetical protein
MMTSTVIEKRIRWAGMLVVAGLLIQLLTMSWTHPLAFMAFLVVGCPLTVGGVLIYLASLASKG